MVRLSLTDEQFVNRVRWWHRYRRVVGAACLLLGIAAMALCCHWLLDLRAQSLALLAELDPLRSPPTTQGMQRVADHTQFSMGFGVGFGLGAGLSASTAVAAGGVALLLGRNRKDRLLLQCWDAAGE